jgi:competence ComEA-like helix-hairpin-helix protein
MLDFTKNEQRVLWFLCAGFAVGLGVWVYRARIQPLPALKAAGPEWREIAVTEVTEPGVPKTAGTAKRKPGGTVSINVNTAPADSLTRVPGIGPVTAGRIITYRNLNGPFQAAESLMQVKGIGPKTYERIKPYIFIDPMKEER